MIRGKGAARSIAPLPRVLGAALLVLILLVSATLAAAQSTELPPESVVRVANTDGAPLNLRSGPESTTSVVAELTEGDLLTVTGPSRGTESERWLPVRATSGANGWVSSHYTALVSLPAPPPVAVVTVAPSPEPMVIAEAPRTESASVVSVPAERGPPVEVEAKVKYPEVRSAKQEITIWVTRNGAPVPGAIVAIRSEDGDDEIDRVLVDCYVSCDG